MDKSILIILTFLCLGVLLTAFVADESISFPEKKIHRTIKKQWKIENFKISEISGFEKNGLTGFYSIKSNSKLLGYLFVGRVNSCRSGGCSIDSEIQDLSFEFFDYFVIIDTLVSIKKVKIFNYQATQGHEVMSHGWLRQFVGYSGLQELRYGKEIEAISGATVSAKALKDDIQFKVKLLKLELANRNFD